MNQTIYLVEIAGKDSYYALQSTIKQLYRSEEDLKDICILPVPLITPVEYAQPIFDKGNKPLYDIDFIEDINNALKIFGINNSTFADYLINGYKCFLATSESFPIKDLMRKLWFKMCMPTKKSIELLGYTFPCIGCHLWCHVSRLISLLIFLKTYTFIEPYANIILVTGERVHHEDTIKANQTKTVLGMYDKIICELFNDNKNENLYKPNSILTLRPVEDVRDQSEIDFSFDIMRNIISKDGVVCKKNLPTCDIGNIYKEDKGRADILPTEDKVNTVKNYYIELIEEVLDSLYLLY